MSRASRCQVRFVIPPSQYAHRTTVATMSSTPAPKDQYHHVIPRFILRDVRNVQDAMELEKKLSILESRAGAVIANIHKTIGTGQSVNLLRSEVGTLRKFLFIMHYRNNGISQSYFDPNHPENAPARKWIEAYRQKFQLESSVDVWLHVLRYYLDTPHETILQNHVELMKRDSLESLLLTMEIDPSSKYEAGAYGSQALMYYMSIWEAADDEEFLLGHNGFGLWEGISMGTSGLHRLFITSPRIAIVLRLNIAALSTVSCDSDLLAIPASRAEVQYRGRSVLSIRNWTHRTRSRSTEFRLPLRRTPSPSPRPS